MPHDFLHPLGHGINVARQIGVRLGLPLAVPADTVTMISGSCLESSRLATQAIRSGVAETVLCGGSGSMSNAAHLLPGSPNRNLSGMRAAAWKPHTRTIPGVCRTSLTPREGHRRQRDGFAAARPNLSCYFRHPSTSRAAVGCGAT